jgi:hypothetical protein
VVKIHKWQRGQNPQMATWPKSTNGNVVKIHKWQRGQNDDSIYEIAKRSK